MNVSPDEATWKVGVDVLSFGATKGGALAAEAVIFFDPARGAGWRGGANAGAICCQNTASSRRRWKRFLADDLWLNLARHANSMADRLSDALAAAGFAPVWPVEANEVFAILPKVVCERLKRKGAAFYERTMDGPPENAPSGDGYSLVRLVASLPLRQATSSNSLQSSKGTEAAQVSINGSRPTSRAHWRNRL